MCSLRVWFLLAFALSSAAAGAAAAKPSGTFGTRAQLRECLALDDTLKARSSGLESAAAAINDRTAANEAEAARLADMKKGLDRSDKAAIAAFNQAAMAHNQHVQQVDEEVSGAEAARTRLAADKADADQKCGAFTYRPADIEAVEKERKNAAAAASAP